LRFTVIVKSPCVVDTVASYTSGATFSIATLDGYNGPFMPGSGIGAGFERKTNWLTDWWYIAVVTQRQIKAHPTTTHLRALDDLGFACADTRYGNSAISAKEMQC